MKFDSFYNIIAVQRSLIDDFNQHSPDLFFEHLQDLVQAYQALSPTLQKTWRETGVSADLILYAAVVVKRGTFKQLLDMGIHSYGRELLPTQYGREPATVFNRLISLGDFEQLSLLVREVKGNEQLIDNSRAWVHTFLDLDSRGNEFTHQKMAEWLYSFNQFDWSYEFKENFLDTIGQDAAQDIEQKMEALELRKRLDQKLADGSSKNIKQRI